MASLMAENATLPHDIRYQLKTPVSVQPYFWEDMTLRYQNWDQRLILNIGTALSFHPSPSTLSHNLCILSGILHSPILTACEEVLELYQSKQVAKEMSQKPDSKHYYKIKVDICGKLVHLLLVKK